MAYRVKLPPEDDMHQLRDSRLPALLKSGDSGDQIGASFEMPGAPAPSVCPRLPNGVRLIRYEPRTPPVIIRLVSTVNDVDKFIRHYLRELDARLHSPLQIRCGDSVFEILSKLAEAGLELAIETPRFPDEERVEP